MYTSRMPISVLDKDDSSEAKMEPVYGRYPKRITCLCNVEEKDVEVITISLNDRCPICNTVHHICVPKRDIKIKELQHAGSCEEQALERPAETLKLKM